MSCSAASGYFNHSTTKTTPTVAIVAYRAPPTDSVSQVDSNLRQLLIGATNSFSINFYSTTDNKIRIGANPPVGNIFRGTAWVNSGIIDYSNAWSINSYGLLGVSWNSTSTSNYSICDFDGEIAEIFLLTSAPTNSAMLEIQTYFNNRYGISFPP
jgi:hypothetical protein